RGEAGAPAEPVDRLVARGPDQPGYGIVRHAGRGPLLERHLERLLQRLLGHVEIAEHANQRGQDPSVLGAKDLLDVHARSRWEGYPPGRPLATRTRLLRRRPLPDGPHLDRETSPHQRVA